MHCSEEFGNNWDVGEDTERLVEKFVIKLYGSSMGTLNVICDDELPTHSAHLSSASEACELLDVLMEAYRHCMDRGPRLHHTWVGYCGR